MIPRTILSETHIKDAKKNGARYIVYFGEWVAFTKDEGVPLNFIEERELFDIDDCKRLILRMPHFVKEL